MNEEVTVTVKCVGCDHRREIGPDEVPEGQHPTCDKCYLPMIPVEARRERG